MPNPKLSYAAAKQVVDLVNKFVDLGFNNPGHPSALTEAAKALKLKTSTVSSRLVAAEHHYKLVAKRTDGGDVVTIEEPSAEQLRDITKQVKGYLLRNPHTLAELTSKTKTHTGHVLDAIEQLQREGVRVHRIGDRYDIPKQLEAAYLGASKLELVSDENNRFLVGVLSDNHCGSKYERRDVLEDLFDRFAARGVKHVLHAGNYLDGDARFNRHDLVAHGIEMQSQLLAETWPKRDGIVTYAITGDDHEGWYSQREGIDVGSYVEGVMRRFERQDWVHLGYMEAAIPLINAETGSRSVASLVHPGGGSTYALSYAIQKIVEALEGGEKPAVGFYGHYHKLWSGNIRNVWTLCTGCAQDQTPFMRKNKIEAHVGGTIVEMEQDPASGAIIGFCPMMLRYFARGFYEHRWSHSQPVNQAVRSVGGV